MNHVHVSGVHPVSANVISFISACFDTRTDCSKYLKQGICDIQKAACARTCGNCGPSEYTLKNVSQHNVTFIFLQESRRLTTADPTWATYRRIENIIFDVLAKKHTNCNKNIQTATLNVSLNGTCVHNYFIFYLFIAQPSCSRTCKYMLKLLVRVPKRNRLEIKLILFDHKSCHPLLLHISHIIPSRSSSYLVLSQYIFSISQCCRMFWWPWRLWRESSSGRV